MKHGQRVVWSEGLLMSPQHLQQQDLYQEELLAARLDAIGSLNWGVLKLEFDPRALESGQIRVTDLSVVMPDGLVLRSDREDPSELPPSRPVEGHFPHGSAAVDVYLAVPRERDGGGNYARSDRSTARYLVYERSVADSVGDAPSIDVPFAHRQVTIRFGDEALDDFISIKIAEMVRDSRGSLAVSDAYMPPLLRIGASSFLLAGLERLLGLIATRRRALTAQQRERSEAAVAYNATDITRFLLLNTLNGFTPILHHFLDMSDVAPREAYLWLASLAGQLGTFASRFDPNKIPKFNHLDLRSSFRPLFGLIADLVQTNVQDNYVVLALTARDDGMFLGQFDDERLVGCQTYLLAVRSSRKEQETAAELPRLSKVASWGDINEILSAATPGAPMEVAYRPPPEVSVKAGVVYFTLGTNNDYWRNVVTDRQIAVYLPPPFDPETTQVELIGVPRPARPSSV